MPSALSNLEKDRHWSGSSRSPITSRLYESKSEWDFAKGPIQAARPKDEMVN
jgi:hypothetical protein